VRAVTLSAVRSNHVTLPAVERPAVSVLMVTYGGFDDAVRAAADLVAGTDPVYELIVYDNASPDGTGERLADALVDATVIVGDRNLGFGGANNEAAARARGEVIVLLNSDCFVRTGWLPPLLMSLERRHRCGAAAPMFLHLDGRLQEAGSLLGAGGSAHAYGDGDDATRPEYAFPRVIDYASAACLAIRRDTYSELGGFDPMYGLGYYEDVDLLLRMKRDLGLLAWYEPRSRAYHRRGGSFVSRESAQLMLRNRRILAIRHDAVLRRRPRVTSGTVGRSVVRLRDAPASHRLLIVDDRVPHWDRGSGDPRMAQVVETAARLLPTTQITLLARDAANAAHYAPRFLARRIEVVTGVDPVSWIAERERHYDAVYVSRPNNHADLADVIDETQPYASRAYDAEALYHRRLMRMADLATGADRERLIRRSQAAALLERDAVRRADVVTCVSEDEAAWIASVRDGSDPVVLPVIARFDAAAPGYRDRRDVIFFGGFMAGPDGPNADAARFAAEEVMPLVRQQLPDVRLRVVGADPTVGVLALASEHVDVVGYVADADVELRAARVLLAPVRFGAGVKIRLVEAVAAGLPFVTTECGAEGLSIEGLAGDLVADDPSDLAQLVVRLYADEAAWSRARADLTAALTVRFGRLRFTRQLASSLASLGLPVVNAPG
jgi:O-antigen biosynthesis protein